VSVRQLQHAVHLRTYVAEVQCDYCSASRHNISDIDHFSVETQRYNSNSR